MEQTIKLLIEINRNTTHKLLCRSMQQCLQQIFSFEDCVCFLRDSTKNQFFNLVYAEADDRANTFQTSCLQIRNRIKQLKEAGEHKNREIILAEQKRLQEMIDSEQFNIDSSNLTLSPTQMIYIPKKVGLSHLSESQRRVVYVNDFDSNQIPEYFWGADNIAAIKSVKNFAVGPMFTLTNEVCGLFFFYNSKTKSVSMNTLRKMRAMAKMLGGCGQMVEIMGETLLIKVGLQLKLRELQAHMENKERKNN